MPLAEDSALRNAAEARCIIDPNPVNVNEGSRLMEEVEPIRLRASKNPELRNRPGLGGGGAVD